MSYYYATNQSEDQAGYFTSNEFAQYSYPPPVHLPPPNVTPEFYSHQPPPGQFYTPNVNDFQPDPYNQSSEYTRSDRGPHSSGGFSNYNKNEGRSNQDWRHSQQNSSRGRGQGYRRGSTQGYRGGQKSRGHERDDRYYYERNRDQGYDRNVGDSFDSRSNHGYGKGHGFEQGQGHGYERGKRTGKRGSVHEQDSRHKRESSGKKQRENDTEGKENNFVKGKTNLHVVIGKSEESNIKTCDGEKLIDSKCSIRSSEGGDAYDVISDPLEGNNRWCSIDSQGPESEVIERKSKTYSSDQDFLEKNFASFTKKSSNKASVTEYDGNPKSQKGHSEKPRSGHQQSRPKNYSEKPQSERQTSRGKDQSQRPKSGKQQPPHKDNYLEKPKSGKQPLHNDDYSDRPPKSGHQQSKPNPYPADDQRAGQNPGNRYCSDYGKNRQSEDYYTDKRQYSSKKDNRFNEKNSPRDGVSKRESRKESNRHNEVGDGGRVDSGNRREMISTERERKDSDRDSVHSKDSSNYGNNDRKLSELSTDWSEVSLERSGSRTVSESQSEASDDLNGDQRRKHEKKDIHYKPMRKQNNPYHHPQQHQKGHGKGKPPVVRTASGRVDESQRGGACFLCVYVNS